MPLHDSREEDDANELESHYNSPLESTTYTEHDDHVPPPMTTNRTTPKAHDGMGLRF